MPSVPIDDQGTVLQYEDSGAPPGSTDYMTVFMLSAYLWHGGIFRPMFPHAAAYNLRLIAIHPREYCGSSPYTDDELTLMQSDDEDDQATVLREHGHGLAHFIAHVIKHESLPPLTRSGGTTTGGVAILGRSAGGTIQLALLANLDSLDKPTYELLERYVRTFIIHDAPTMVFGVPEPAGSSHPLKDVTLSLEQAMQNFITWTTSCYEPISDLSTVTPEVILKRKNMAQTSSDPQYAPTRMGPTELAEFTTKEVAERLGPLFVSCDISMSNTRRALVDTRGEWSDVKVIISWSDMTFWTALWAVKAVSDLVTSPEQEGQRREVRFVPLVNAKSWFHLEDPERMLRLIVEQSR